jgi:hypothetical protein
VLYTLLATVFIKMKIDDTQNKIGKQGYGSITVVNRGTDNEYRKGTFTFNKGIIEIYDEPRLTSFSFLYDGIYYTRVLSDKKKPYTDNGLIRMAAKYGREILANCG